MTLKKVGFYILIMCFTLKINAQHPDKDSLQDILHGLQGEERLKKLNELEMKYLYQPKSLDYGNLLMEEAQKQNNYYYQYAALNIKIAYYRFFATDSLVYYAKMAEELTSKHKLYSELFLIRQMLVLNYLWKGYYNLGLNKAKEMYMEAKEINDPEALASAQLSMGDAYLAMERFSEAIDCFKEARNLLLLAKESQNPIRLLNCYTGIVTTYTEQGNLEAVWPYMDSLRNETLRVKLTCPDVNPVDYEITNLLCYASCYMAINHLTDAWATIEEIDKRLEEEPLPYYRLLLNEMKMHYFYLRQDYEKMWYYYGICYRFCSDNNFVKKLRTLLKFKAETLYKLRDYEESAQTYKQLQQHADSLNLAIHYYEIEQLRIDYELDKRENEIARQKTEIKLRFSFNLILGTLALFLLIAIGIIWTNLKSIQHKNFFLFNQIKELTQTKIELLAFKETLRIRTDPQLCAASEVYDGLYERVEEYMEMKKPYINSDYGRKNLIADMNTNEVYLSKAIRSAVNMSIQEYINSQRIEYAKTLLLQDMNQTIESVAMDAGFTTIRNFYRLFKETYGMSPSEFRNYVKKNLVGDKHNTADEQ
ncbi:MAG: helix-turn-helix domain-containing protein [Candidatus Azobacteroides sp.]|nr:helix-turn-helix domain-containing protein [Candidatus Azobacteroides sp.]